MVELCALGCLFILLLICWYQAIPTVTHIRYFPTTAPNPDSISVEVANMPISFESQSSGMFVTFTMHVPSVLHASLFTIRADDCLKDLRINNQFIPKELIGQCIIDRPRDIAIGQFLQSGDNIFAASVPDTGGYQRFGINISRSDPLMIGIRLAVAIVFMACILFFWWPRTRSRYERYVLILFLIGIALRFFYADATPYDIRSNDADGHVDYIAYVADHWRVPPIHGGWEFYQPPLYYVTTAPFYAALNTMDFPRMTILRFLQYFSVSLSITIFGLCVWMAYLLFDERHQTERLLWIGFFAVFPGLILMSAKINNDILVQCLTFAGIALALRFWHKGETIVWYTLIVVISAGLLTKMNSLALVPVAFAVLLCHNSLSYRRKIILGIVGIFVVLSLTEWLFILRTLQDSQVGVVGNIGNLNGELVVSNGLMDYLRFNPMEVLYHPYNNPWSDEYRRNLFFEYFFKSAFIGEWDFGSMFRRSVQLMYVAAMMISLFAAVGFFISWRASWRRAMPLWILFVSVLVLHLALRTQYAYAPSQDFRYSTVILVPVIFFALTILQMLPTLLRSIVVILLSSFIVLCGIFIVTLSVINPL